SWPFVISLKATLRRVVVWSPRLVELPTLSLQPSRPLLALSGHVSGYPPNQLVAVDEAIK
ncbi:MAG: hypothetical protein WCF29_10205, partial [Pseudolabrys sp.]